MPVATELRGVVAEFVAAVNAFDLDRIVATFTADAYVNDVSRGMWGTNAIRGFMSKEIVGDHVTMEVREVLDHYWRHHRPCPRRRDLRQDQPARRAGPDQLLRAL